MIKASRPLSLENVLPRIITLCNQKGGVGKTMICAGLAAAFAGAGEEVTLLDLDPLGNATRLLLDDVPRKGAFEFLCGQSAAELGVPSRIEGLRILAGTPLLHLAEMDEPIRTLDHTLLRRRLLNETGAGGIVLIDSPPGLGITAVTAMAAADMVLIPAVPDGFALPALERTIAVTEALAESPAIRILLNLSGSDPTEAREVSEAIRRRYSRLLLPFRLDWIPPDGAPPGDTLIAATLPLSALLLGRDAAAPRAPSHLVAEMRHSTRLRFSRAALGLFLSFAASASLHLAAVYHSIQLERQIRQKEPLHLLGTANLRMWKN